MNIVAWLLAATVVVNAPMAQEPAQGHAVEHELTEAFTQIKRRHLDAPSDQALLKGARSGMASWVRERPSYTAQIEGIEAPEDRLVHLFRAHLIHTKTDAATLKDVAIAGMLTAIKEPHPIYLRPQHSKILVQADGAYSGVGIQWDKVEDGFLLKKVFEFGPADLAGLQPGSVVVAIDGHPAAPMSMAEAVTKVRGRVGTTVELGVRPEGGLPVSVSITRDRIYTDEVAYDMLEGNIVYIRFAKLFPRHAHVMLSRILSRAPRARGLVLDLRGLSGAIVPSLPDLVSLFSDSGRTYMTADRHGRWRDHVSNSHKRLYRGPMVVLVDRNTSGEPEILAGLLQSTGDAIIAGTRTHGNGRVQEEITLSGGGTFHLTTSTAWLTPTHPLEGNGITPDWDLGEGFELDAVVERLGRTLE